VRQRGLSSEGLPDVFAYGARDDALSMGCAEIVGVVSVVDRDGMEEQICRGQLLMYALQVLVLLLGK
jgi:hypothetical protein